MKKGIILFAAILLAGCQTESKPTVVVSSREQTNIAVPPVQKPAPFKPAQFKFAKKDSPNAIVSLDYKNYTMFQEFMLGINKRELDWDTRLEQANRSILLLQGANPTSTDVTIIPTQ